MIHPAAKVSQTVNRKSPHRNMFLQLSTPYNNPECTEIVYLKQKDIKSRLPFEIVSK